jgi:neurofibromin 1
MAVEDVATAFIAGNSLGPRRSTESAATAASAMAPIGSTASLDDPPPLEEPLAKFILTVVGRFLQTSAPDLFENTAVVAMNAATTTTNPTSSALDAKVETAQADPSVNQTRTLLMSDVHKSAGRILFYVSASNWPIVFQRLKARLMFLAGTNDENADTSDLRLLEWCNLNSKRLSSVIQDLCTVFLQMKRNSQLAMAVVLRKAIWNWIEVYPKDFMQLNRQQRRLDGGPEILFDNCNGLTESNPRKKAMFWPLQVMLLVLCPDILLKIVLSDSTYKKAGFIDNLKNSLKASRLAADIAAVAFVDLCKAATYVNRDEKSALWQLVPEVENELKERLFDASKPFLTPEGAIDQRLMTECLTALFRLDPRKTLKNLIPVCLQSSAPMAFKLVLVKSCYAIASESHLSWNPSISSMYTELASSFRQILHTAVREKQSQEALAAAQPTPLVPQKTIRKPFDNRAAKKNAAVSAANTEASERHELVLNILRLYRTDPKLAIFSDSADRQREENRALMVGLTNWLRDPSPALRNNAAETLLSLHKPVYMEQWGAAGDAMRSFWIISSQVMLALARQLLEYKERDEGLRLTLDLLMQLLVLRNDFLRKKKDMINNGIEAPDRLSASVALEVALLVLLCSAETEICSKAIACLGHLCEEARLADEVPTTLDEIEDETQEPGQTSLYSSQLTVVENFITYAELTSVGVLMPGRVAQQKRIRKMLRKMDKQTPGNLAAWEEAYKRWRALMQAVAKPFDSDAAEGDAGTMSMANAGQKDPPVKKPGFAARMVGLGSMTNQAKAAPAPTNHPSPAAGVLGASDFLEDRGEWQNYTGFLCALGGVCLHERGRERIKAIAMQGPPTTESGRMIDRFVHELVDLLVCDNMVVREVVQQTLGADLSPSLYGTPLFWM